MALPVVIVASGGLPVTEIAAGGPGLPVLVSSIGLPVTVVASGGLPVIGASTIVLSASTLAENSAEGTAIGNLSVVNATGTAAFTLVDSSSNKVKLAGANNVNVQAGSSAVNYEAPTTSFTFTVSVSGVTPAIPPATFTVIVTDVNEASPVITSNGGGPTASINHPENTFNVATVTATDADGSAVITYSIVGGTDAADFLIGGSSGQLIFATAPDYELPHDSNTDNVYEVIVQASDGTNTDQQTLTITVTDVGEGGGGGSTGLEFNDELNSQYVALLEDF